MSSKVLANLMFNHSALHSMRQLPGFLGSFVPRALDSTWALSKHECAFVEWVSDPISLQLFRDLVGDCSQGKNKFFQDCNSSFKHTWLTLGIWQFPGQELQDYYSLRSTFTQIVPNQRPETRSNEVGLGWGENFYFFQCHRLTMTHLHQLLLLPPGPAVLLLGDLPSATCACWRLVWVSISQAQGYTALTP